MRKKIKTHKRRTSADTLLKTSKKKDIELTERELDKVSGGNVGGHRRWGDLTLKRGID